MKPRGGNIVSYFLLVNLIFILNNYLFYYISLFYLLANELIKICQNQENSLVSVTTVSLSLDFRVKCLKCMLIS